LREAAGINQVAMAAQLGCAQSTVSRIEQGRQPPTVAALEVWLAACGATGGEHDELLTLLGAGAPATRAVRPDPRCPTSDLVVAVAVVPASATVTATSVGSLLRRELEQLAGGDLRLVADPGGEQAR
jgi:transcriptional regulator with XRE-family HTH domain